LLTACDDAFVTVKDSSWASDRVDRVGQGINNKVNIFFSSGNTTIRKLCDRHEGAFDEEIPLSHIKT
jgi:hypothetical protein